MFSLLRISIPVWPLCAYHLGLGRVQMAYFSRGTEESLVKGLFTEVWPGLRDTDKECETSDNRVEPLLPLGLGNEGRMVTESLERPLFAGEDCPAGRVSCARAS